MAIVLCRHAHTQQTGVVIVTFDCDGCSASSVSQEDQTAINNDVICPGLFVKNSCADEYDFVWTDGSIVITATPVPDDGSDSGLETIVASVCDAGSLTRPVSAFDLPNLACRYVAQSPNIMTGVQWRLHVMQ